VGQPFSDTQAIGPSQKFRKIEKNLEVNLEEKMEFSSS
jgi:hypothetical protein